jgi:hypothetical protein
LPGSNHSRSCWPSRARLGGVEPGDHLVAARCVAGAGVGGQLLQLLGGGAGALEPEVGVLVGPQRLQHVHHRREDETVALPAVHQGGVLEVLWADPDDELAAGAGPLELGPHLGPDHDVAEGGPQLAVLEGAGKEVHRR